MKFGAGQWSDLMYNKIMLKHFKNYYHVFTVLLMFVITVFAYSYFSETRYFAQLQLWAQSNFWRFFTILILIKTVGIVWPPLPGVVISLGAIPIVGWFPAFAADAIGWYIGATIAFLLSRRYGLRTVKFFFGEMGVERVKKFKVNPNRELEVLIIMKCLGGSIGEFINYAAGLTTIKFWNFTISNFVASLIIGLPLFYSFHFALKSGNNLFFALIPLVIGVIFFYVFRKRYFIWEELEEDQKEKPE
jgi:uncharacterized membrane protein YdjX (TVP38/TMEM64 family)